jgi:hypothetical protein
MPSWRGAQLQRKAQRQPYLTFTLQAFVAWGTFTFILRRPRAKAHLLQVAMVLAFRENGLTIERKLKTGPSELH